jgi:putative phage-type endonuclease
MEDLSILENIYHLIKTDDSLIEMEKNDLEEIILIIIDEFINTYPLLITEEKFDELLEQHVEEEITLILENIQINEVLQEELENIVEKSIFIYFQTIGIPRSYSSSIILSPPEEKRLAKQIDILRSIPQPEQRTNDWYIFRHNLITASNAYKAFENECPQNQLIYEKCKPLLIEEKKNIRPVSIDSPLHWGQKYEPLSVYFYEEMYDTKIEDFGCISHNKYNFLGASPDGINVKEQNSRYGRMLEIKNIVSRKITGIPKKEYWIQMQLQMEVCDLDECDFLETKFEEYENEEEYLKDEITKNKGIILYFSGPNCEHKYIYKPLNMDFTEKWQEENMEYQEKKGYIWIKNIYWKLQKYSCVLVIRNKCWFNSAIVQLENIWNIIIKERESGYDHRKSKPRKIKPESCLNLNNEQFGCLLNIDKYTNLATLK